jgi:nitrite reductase/ring-hydroxylating ferredoxin subunit
MDQESICVGTKNDLAEDGYMIAQLPNGSEVLVLTAGGVLYAIGRKCPHEGAPLERGQVWEKMIRCGQHAFTFDLETGEGLNCPGYSIERYDVREQDGKIFLGIDGRQKSEV